MASFCVFSLFFVLIHRTGSFCGVKMFVVPLATCCGSWPLRPNPISAIHKRDDKVVTPSSVRQDRTNKPPISSATFVSVNPLSRRGFASSASGIDHSIPRASGGDSKSQTSSSRSGSDERQGSGGAHAPELEMHVRNNPLNATPIASSKSMTFQAIQHSWFAHPSDIPAAAAHAPGVKPSRRSQQPVSSADNDRIVGLQSDSRAAPAPPANPAVDAECSGTAESRNLGDYAEKPRGGSDAHRTNFSPRQSTFRRASTDFRATQRSWFAHPDDPVCESKSALGITHSASSDNPGSLTRSTVGGRSDPVASGPSLNTVEDPTGTLMMSFKERQALLFAHLER